MCIAHNCILICARKPKFPTAMFSPPPMHIVAAMLQTSLQALYSPVKQCMHTKSCAQYKIYAHCKTPQTPKAARTANMCTRENCALWPQCGARTSFAHLDALLHYHHQYLILCLKTIKRAFEYLSEGTCLAWSKSKVFKEQTPH